MAFISIGFLVFVVIICVLLRYQFQQGVRTARRRAQERRRQQRENNSRGLTEEERNHARFKLFVAKFHSQTVLPDKSNISALSLRSSEMKPGEEQPQDGDGSSKFDVSDRSAINKSSSGSRHFSSWKRPPEKDECCICLECYDVGETICAPITKECNHVFHEGCILQWVKKNDKCPLCRVDLLKD